MSYRLHQISAEDSADAFPPSETALKQPNGLLAYGGDLSPARLIAAYRRGIFPWYGDDEPVLWWSPNPRTVFIPGEIRVSKRLSRTLRQRNYAVTLDQAFEDVVIACAQPRSEHDGTWLIPEMRQAYLQMHTLGFAHSIEVWKNRKLVAGLYGIALGRAFFGESMFHTHSDMSKIALVELSQLLHRWGYLVLDGQVGSQHLFSMGAINMPRDEFERLLHRAIPTTPLPGEWLYDNEQRNSETHLPQ